MTGIPRPQAVSPYRLTELAAVLPAEYVGPADATVTGVSHASGELRPGDLYAALPGTRRHGAEVILVGFAVYAAYVIPLDGFAWPEGLEMWR